MATKLIGISGGRDENGIISLTQPWHCDTLEECFRVGEKWLVGVPQVSRNFGTWDATIVAGFQIGVNYVGPDPEVSENLETFDLDGDTSTENMETHWNLDALLKKWGGRIVQDGDEEKVVFLKELPDSSGSPTGFQIAGPPSKWKTNPMFGKKTYELYGAIWTHTYVRKRMPPDLLSRIGKIVKRPPGNPPTPEGRDWAILAPDVTVYKNGTGVRISDYYKLSPPGGWPPELVEVIVV